MIQLLFISFFLIAIFFSMLGLGGGILYVPLLLQTGLSYYEAAATALSIIIVLSLTASVIYHLNNLVDWKIVFLLNPFALTGAYFAGANSKIVPEKILLIMFSCVMLISAFFMLLPVSEKKRIIKNKNGFIESNKMGHKYHINLWLGIPLAFLSGVFSALLGIGGGFANVPLMTLIFNVPIKVAVATSSAMIIITSAAGFLGHSHAGHINIKLSLILASAAFFGALIGSHLSVKADKKFLNITSSIILITVSIWMILKAIFNL